MYTSSTSTAVRTLLAHNNNITYNQSKTQEHSEPMYSSYLVVLDSTENTLIYTILFLHT